jgi:hypothetical protein
MGLEIASVIGLAAFSAGASVGVANAITFGLANFGGLILSAGLSGAQALIASANRPNSANLSPEAQGVQQIIRQATPAQRLVVGQVVTSGAMFFAESKAPQTYYGILLAAHEVDSFQSVIINGVETFFDDNGDATASPFRDGDNVYLSASFRNGSLDQAIDPIIDQYFDMPSTFRQRGHATVVFRRTHGFGGSISDKNEDHRRVWGDSGVFNPLVKFKGAKMHDPRRPGSVQSDASTHQWSDNAAICLAHALTYQWPDKRIFEPARLNWDLFARAADECDQWQTDRNGGTFRRYTANGVLQSTERIFDVMEAFRAAMGGDVAIEAGKIYPVPAVPRQAVATVHNGMVVGGFRYSPERDSSQLVNIVKTQFQAPDREYQTIEGPVIRRDALITADGQPLEQTLSLSYVQGDPRAQRLAHMTIEQSRAQKTLEIGVRREAAQWRIGDRIRVYLDGSLLSKVNGDYRLLSRGWNPDMQTYQVALTEWTDEAWNFGPDDEQDFVLDDDTVNAEAI